MTLEQCDCVPRWSARPLREAANRNCADCGGTGLVHMASHQERVRRNYENDDDAQATGASMLDPVDLDLLQQAWSQVGYRVNFFNDARARSIWTAVPALVSEIITLRRRADVARKALNGGESTHGQTEDRRVDVTVRSARSASRHAAEADRRATEAHGRVGGDVGRSGIDANWCAACHSVLLGSDWTPTRPCRSSHVNAATRLQRQLGLRT